MTEHSKPAQVQQVLNYMVQHNGITSYDAIRELGITRLSARIFELRDQGWDIDSSWVQTTNRHGKPCRFAKYKLNRK